jgi:DNA-directed RNA polymerase I, II, and III subunit RPABC3
MESSAKVVFEDIFEVTALNPDGYKFDRVNRIQGICLFCFEVSTLCNERNISSWSIDSSESCAVSPCYLLTYLLPYAALGTTFECDLLLDINSEIYSLKEADKVTLVLAPTLHLDGSPADHTSYVPSTEPTLADNYEYVMHGRVFDIKYQKDGTVVIALSFGGLLMRLTGEQKHLTSINPDMRLFLLLKKD